MSGKSGIVNFYELKDVKKHLPSADDKQKQFTGMKIDSRILMSGASGSGKSNALLNYIYATSQPKNGTFKHIFLCFKTDEPLYQYLEERLEGDITLFRGLDQFPDITSFPQQNKDKYLVIFDDCINDKSKTDLKKINDYFSFSRKLGVTTLFLSQSYFTTETFIRKNINYLILTSIASTKDLKRICAEYDTNNVTAEEIAELFDIATEKETESDMNFFKIDLNNVKVDVKFSRNFIEYL